MLAVRSGAGAVVTAFPDGVPEVFAEVGASGVLFSLPMPLHERLARSLEEGLLSVLRQQGSPPTLPHNSVRKGKIRYRVWPMARPDSEGNPQISSSSLLDVTQYRYAVGMS